MTTLNTMSPHNDIQKLRQYKVSLYVCNNIFPWPSYQCSSCAHAGCVSCCSSALSHPFILFLTQTKKTSISHISIFSLLNSGVPGRVCWPSDHLLNVLLPPSLHLLSEIWLHHQQALGRPVSVSLLMFSGICCDVAGMCHTIPGFALLKMANNLEMYSYGNTESLY